MFVEEKLNLNLDFNKKKLKSFLAEHDLLFEPCDSCYCIFDNEKIIACGCRDGNILKCFAISNEYRSMGLFDKIISSLLTECYNLKKDLTFVFTKLDNINFFTNFSFKELARGENSVLLYKSDKSIINILEKLFIDNVPLHILENKKIGAVVMNANPFTLGHKYLIEKSLSGLDYLFVFVVQEDKSFFSFDERFMLVKENTKELSNVFIIPSTNFLISTATFPSYFLKEKKLVSTEHALIDSRIFGKYFVPTFKIATRFLGDEPIDKSTQLYNEVLCSELPKYNCDVKIIKRLRSNKNFVSASLVRKFFVEKDFENLSKYVSNFTLNFLKTKSDKK
ncbi:MAG: adenylyltransferase/cytidyltransferase family protein [Treponemataceae bacterium]